MVVGTCRANYTGIIANYTFRFVRRVRRMSRISLHYIILTAALLSLNKYVSLSPLYLLSVEIEERFIFNSAHIFRSLIRLLSTIFIYLHPSLFVDATISFGIAEAEIKTFVWINKHFSLFFQTKIYVHFITC